MNAARNPAPRLVLPHDVEAEQGVLGAVLHNNAALAQASDVLSPGSFLLPKHRDIFQTMLAMAQEEAAIDELTLAALLSSQGKLEQVGGRAYLLSLQDMTPVAANILAYAEIVRGKWLLRQLIEKAQEIAEQGQRPTEDAEALVVQAQEIFRDLADQAERRTASAYTQSAEEGTKEFLDWLDSAPEERRDVLTGTKLDGWLGPLSTDRPTVIAANAGGAKSTLTHHIARHNARTNSPTLIFDLENGSRKAWGRMLAAESSLDGRKLLNRDRNGMGNLDWERLDVAQERFRQLPIYVHSPRRLPTIRDLAHVSRWHVENRGVRLIIIDHIRLIRTAPGEIYDEQRRRIAGVVALQKVLHIPIVLVSHLNTEGRLRGAQELLDDSAAVVILERNENLSDEEKALAETGEHTLIAKIIKNEAGPISPEGVKLKHWPWKFEVE